MTTQNARLSDLGSPPVSAGLSTDDPAAAEAHRAFLGRNYFPLLDGLRAISIIGVVWFHATNGLYASGLLSRGNSGVSLFFVISGFLITTLLLREQSNTGAISMRRFYLRRGLRIFPLYYAVLALYGLMVLVVEKHSQFGVQFWHNLPFFLTYTSNWFVPLGSDRIIFFFAWSLATEEQFYLFWPWMVRRRVQPLALIAPMLGLIAAHYLGMLGTSNGASGAMWVLMRVLNQLSPPICLGAIAAILSHQPATFRWLHRLTAWRWSAPVALAAVIAALAVDAAPDWVAFIAMTWLVVACVLRPEGQPLAPFLTNRVVKHIGVVSYGVYLLHMLSINLVRGVTHAPNGTLLFALTLPVSIVAATLSYRLFETPFLRLKDRLEVKPAPLTVSAEAIARAMTRRATAVAAPVEVSAPSVFGRRTATAAAG